MLYNMGKDKLINKIEEYIHISASEEELIKSVFKSKTYKANEHIHWAQGESAYFIYVVKGLVHAYHVDEGKHVTTNLVAEDHFISPYLSFLIKEPSREYIQCLEDCEILTLTRSKMEDLYKSVKEWNKLGRIFAQYNFELMAERVLPKTKDDKERFLGYFQITPRSVFERVPIEVLSSFLEIHEDNLVRLIDRHDV